jgi:flagellar biosynthetic protein FlhB
MAQNAAGQKTEKPTPKRLREARKKGQIPRSPDLVGWIALLAATYLIPFMVRRLGGHLRSYFIEFHEAVAAGNLDLAMQSPIELLLDGALVLLPFLFFLAFLTAMALAVQGGVTLTLDPLKPKFERISPKSGVKRLFSSQSLVDTAKAVFRLVALVAVMFQVMASRLDPLTATVPRPMERVGEDVTAAMLLVVRLAALLGVVVGLADYAYQRWKTGKQLKMTKDEVKRENKNTEGDPLIRSRRRAQHQKISQNKMLAAVPEASVVVVNPTHVAVALAYEQGGVPKVVAKGADDLAFRIRERAFEAGVPVVESRPLARILHDLLDVGAEVPANLYEAVAIVIAFVMRLPPTAVRRTVRQVTVPASKLASAARDEAPATDLRDSVRSDQRSVR